MDVAAEVNIYIYIQIGVDDQPEAALRCEYEVIFTVTNRKSFESCLPVVDERRNMANKCSSVVVQGKPCGALVK